MAKYKYSIAALVMALVFWFFDSSIHYFVYAENEFEFLPSNINELWMRSLVVILMVFFGFYADWSQKALMAKEKQLEANLIYQSTMNANQHILNNLLNKMQLFKTHAMKLEGISDDHFKECDEAIEEAVFLINKLSKLKDVNNESITASIDVSDNSNS